MEPGQSRAKEARRQLATGPAWKAAAAVAVMLLALTLAWFLWFPAPPETFVVHLEQGARGLSRDPIAPPGRPLVLHITGAVTDAASPADAVSWEVSVMEAATGAQVFTRSGVRRSGESALQVELSPGLQRAGRYDVHVVQEGGAGTRPLDATFHFFIAQAP